MEFCIPSITLNLSGEPDRTIFKLIIVTICLPFMVSQYLNREGDGKIFKQDINHHRKRPTIKIWTTWKCGNEHQFRRKRMLGENNIVYNRSSSPSLCDICATYAPHPWDIIPVTAAMPSHLVFDIVCLICMMEFLNFTNSIWMNLAKLVQLVNIETILAKLQNNCPKTALVHHQSFPRKLFKEMAFYIFPLLSLILCDQFKRVIL